MCASGKLAEGCPAPGWDGGSACQKGRVRSYSFLGTRRREALARSSGNSPYSCGEGGGHNLSPVWNQVKPSLSHLWTPSALFQKGELPSKCSRPIPSTTSLCSPIPIAWPLTVTAWKYYHTTDRAGNGRHQGLQPHTAGARAQSRCLEDKSFQGRKDKTSLLLKAAF